MNLARVCVCAGQMVPPAGFEPAASKAARKVAICANWRSTCCDVPLFSMASTASRESPWRWATSVMAFSASGTVAFIIVNLSSSVPVRDYASHAGICTGRLAVHLRSARNRMVLAFYPALSVVEWWAVLGCWVIWHCWSSFRAPGRPTWAYPTQACFRPAAYRSAIRRGGTFVGDGTLGSRWSGLVECVRHFR